MQLRVAQFLRHAVSIGCAWLPALLHPSTSPATASVGAPITEVPAEWLAEHDRRRRLLATAEHIGDKSGMIHAELELADSARYLDRWDEAIENYRRVRDVPVEELPSSAPERVSADVGLAVSYYGRGDLDLARQRAK